MESHRVFIMSEPRESNLVEYTHGICMDGNILAIRTYEESKMKKLQKNKLYLLKAVKVHKKFITITHQSKVYEHL